jgi:hypothetical protein
MPCPTKHMLPATVLLCLTLKCAQKKEISELPALICATAIELQSKIAQAQFIAGYIRIRQSTLLSLTNHTKYKEI